MIKMSLVAAVAIYESDRLRKETFLFQNGKSKPPSDNGGKGSRC